MTKQGALRTGIQMQACQTLVSGFPRLWSWSGKLTGVSCEGLGRRRGARQADQWELGHLFFASPDSLSTLFTLVKVHTQWMNRGLPALQLLGAQSMEENEAWLVSSWPFYQVTVGWWHFSISYPVQIPETSPSLLAAPSLGVVMCPCC